MESAKFGREFVNSICLRVFIGLVDMLVLWSMLAKPMTNKRLKKTKSAQPQAESQGAAVTNTIPDASALAEAAKQEKRVIAARDYARVIDILRDEKRFSFQKIADWLNERGVPLDNNEVYRVYTANIPAVEKQAMQATGVDIDPED